MTNPCLFTNLFFITIFSGHLSSNLDVTLPLIYILWLYNVLLHVRHYILYTENHFFHIGMNGCWWFGFVFDNLLIFVHDYINIFTFFVVAILVYLCLLFILLLGFGSLTWRINISSGQIWAWSNQIGYYFITTGKNFFITLFIFTLKVTYSKLDFIDSVKLNR